MEIEAMGWMVAIAGAVAFGGLLYCLLDVVARDRLMRCPDTGSITFVRVGSTDRGEGEVPKVMGCELWPDRTGCAQGCLARYAETTPGLRVNLKALRPFETP